MKLAPLFLLIAACADADAAWETQGLRFQDEGTHKGYATAVNCAGAGITCTVAAGKATLTVPGGGGTGTPGGVGGNIQVNDGLGAFAAYPGTTCAYAVKTLNASGVATCTAAPTIPADISGASYWTRVAEAGLSSETALGALGTGIVLNTTTTGVPTIYVGTSCSADQYMNALDASGVKTCAQVAYSQVSGTPTLFNQTLQEEASSVTQRATVNFIGPAVTVADDAGNSKTKVTVVASGIGACAANQYANTLNDGAAPTCSQVAYSQVSGTPTIPADISGASYITKVAEAGLSNEFALGSLTTGLLRNTTTTGVPVIYAGTSCTNQFPRSLDASGAATCASVSLTADITGTLGAANGGTGTTQGNGGCVTLGTANGATVTVGPVTWTGTFNEIIVEYEITGYGGGTPVGRVLVGAASISTTALTNGTSASEGIAGTLTNSLSIPGAPLAVTLSSIGRSGTFHMRGRSGALKRYEIIGQNGNASVSAASTLYRAVGNFSDLGTNLPIQRAQLTVYDNLTATAASSQTFNSGTTITVIGCP